MIEQTNAELKESGRPETVCEGQHRDGRRSDPILSQRADVYEGSAHRRLERKITDGDGDDLWKVQVSRNGPGDDSDAEGSDRDFEGHLVSYATISPEIRLQREGSYLGDGWSAGSRC